LLRGCHYPPPACLHLAFCRWKDFLLFFTRLFPPPVKGFCRDAGCSPFRLGSISQSPPLVFSPNFSFAFCFVVFQPRIVESMPLFVELRAFPPVVDVLFGTARGFSPLPSSSFFFVFERYFRLPFIPKVTLLALQPLTVVSIFFFRDGLRQRFFLKSQRPSPFHYTLCFSRFLSVVTPLFFFSSFAVSPAQPPSGIILTLYPPPAHPACFPLLWVTPFAPEFFGFFRNQNNAAVG